MSEQSEVPVLLFEKPEDWSSWLDANADAQAIWLKFAKKGQGVKSINYDQALEVALCYGWIDGLVNRLDETFYLQRFTPRRLKSSWSVRNCGLAEQLITEGKMQPAGQTQIDLAKADGRWTAAYESPSNAQIPLDFLKALAKNQPAETFYKTLNKTNLYAIYYRLHTAQKPETRAARINKIIARLAEGQKFH